MAGDFGAGGWEERADAMRDAAQAAAEDAAAQEAAGDAARQAGEDAAASAAGFEAQAEGARSSRGAFAVLDEALAEYDEMTARAGEEAVASAAAFEAQAGAMRAARDAALEAAAAFSVEAESTDRLAGGMSAFVAGLGDSAGAMERSFAVGRDGIATMQSLDEAVTAVGGGYERQIWAINGVADAMQNAGKVTQDVTRDTNDAGNAARNATRFWGVMPLTWNAIHWAITGTAEALAVIIPAMVAAGSAGAVGLQGAVDVAQRMEAVYAATEATYSYLGKTVSTGLGQGIDQFTASAGQAANAGDRLHDALQQAQNAAQPRVYELLGAAVDGASGKLDIFTQIGSQTIDMLDRFAAKLDIELAGPLGNLGQAIGQNAVTDLQELGQVFGNLGHAIADAAGEMPGMANLLLTILDAGTQVLAWAMHFQGVLETLFLAHEAYMWGGLLQTALTGVTSALGKATEAVGTFAVRSAEMAGFETVAAGVDTAAVGMMGALESTAAFLGGPWGLAIGAGVVAMALLVPKLLDAKDATQQWISSLEQTVSQASGLEQIGATYQALQQVTLASAQAQRDLSAAMDDSSNHITGVQSRLSGPYSEALLGAAQNASDLSAAQQQLSQDFSTEMSNVQYLSQAYKISYVDAAQLAGDAGVSLTQTLKGNSVAAQEARQMITNLIAGYGGMAAVSTELGQDINAVSFATEVQNGDVSKLNQAWDTFISTVQAPSSTFLSFAQSLQQFSSDASASGASMSGLGGALATSATTVNSASIQLQQDFNSSVTSAEQMLDSMRTVAAITGNGGPLVQGIKDTIQILLPMAGANEGARAQIIALAQEAGGPATQGLQAIAKWAGNSVDPLNDLYSISGKAAAAIQNLGADTQALASTMQSTLNQTLVTQAESLTGVNQKVATYLSDLQKYGPAAAVTQAALANVNDAQSQANTLATTGAGALDALSGKTTQQGQAAETAAGLNQQYVAQIQEILNKTPGASSDVNALTTAITQHGIGSQQFEAAKQNLIDYLAKYVGMQAATTDVTNLLNQWESLLKLPSNKTISVTYSQTGSPIGGSGVYTGAGVGHMVGPGAQVAAAEGWKVPGYGGGDIVPAWLEPGEAVVPKHLVPAVAPFLGAHHVPGFAAGGRAGWNMSDVFAQWAREGWSADLAGHGAGHPVAEAAMKAILASVTQPSKLTGIWDNPLWRDYAKDLKADIGSYGSRDESYWNLLSEKSALSKSEKEAIAHLQHELHLAHEAHKPMGSLESSLASLESSDAKTMAKYAAALAVLDREGFSGGGLVRSYDSGGYLPVGLSMAYNGTGRPEPVGGGGSPVVHVHLHGDLARDELWENMQVRALDYGYLNTGRPTGVWQPAG